MSMTMQFQLTDTFIFIYSIVMIIIVDSCKDYEN